MTSKLAVIMAICFLVNGVNFVLLDETNLLKNEFFGSNIIYLISSCLLLRQINVLPLTRFRGYPVLSTVLEIPLTLLLLELSLFLWFRLQDYVVLNSDDLLLQLTERRAFSWFVCNFCCDCAHYCPDVFAKLVMQVTSLGFLVSVCRFLKLSFYRLTEHFFSSVNAMKTVAT